MVFKIANWQEWELGVTQISSDAFTAHTYACIEKLIGVYKTDLNHIYQMVEDTIKYPSYCAVMYLRISAWKRPFEFSVDSS